MISGPMRKSIFYDLSAFAMPALMPSRKDVDPSGVSGSSGHKGTSAISPLIDLYPSENPWQNSATVAEVLILKRRKITVIILVIYPHKLNKKAGIPCTGYSE